MCGNGLALPITEGLLGGAARRSVGPAPETSWQLKVDRISARQVIAGAIAALPARLRNLAALRRTSGSGVFFETADQSGAYPLWP